MGGDLPGDRNEWAARPITYVRQVLTGFLQGVYQQVPEYQWDPDKNKSKVFIAGFSPIHAESFGNFPCVAVSRSGMQFAGTGIGGVSHRNFRTGAITRTDLLNGMFVVQHISKVEAEAEDLAFFSAEMCWAHQELLARCGIIVSGGVTIEQPAPAGSLVEGDSKGLIAVPVVLPYRVMRKVITTPLGDPILRAIRIRLSSYVADPKSSSGWEPGPSQEPELEVSLARTAEVKE
jgi:hypothetical protein